MSEDYSEEKREEMAEKVKHLLNRTKENGATEEEMLSAIDLATKIMEKYALEMSDVSETAYAAKFVEHVLDIKYANKWRWELVNTVAFNTGVLALHFKNSDSAIYYGRQITVEAAAALAEYLVKNIERLSSEFAKETGTGLTGKRRFARGCSMRVRSRIHESSNLTSDPRLPVLYKTAIEEATEAYPKPIGKKRRVDKEDNTVEFYMGWIKGEKIKLRKEQEQLEREDA